MVGMSRSSGKPIDGDSHLAQSIGDILTTPIGSRVMLRDYGALTPELQDAPFNQATKIRFSAAAAQALRRWEPRIRVSRVRVDGGADGRITLGIEGARTDTPAPNSFITLTIPLRAAV